RLRHGGAAVDVAARDRAAVVAVAIDDDRRDERPAGSRPLALREDRLPLVDAPAEIRQPEPARKDVDLLPGVLADVRHEEVARRAIEREPPRIPHAVDRVRPAAALVAKDLAERVRQRLRAVAGIAAGAAVARPD